MSPTRTPFVSAEAPCLPDRPGAPVNQWISFREGEYLVVRAYLVSPAGAVAPVDQAVIEIYADAGGRRQLKGTGRVENHRMVALLEDYGTLDLILDLGEGFVYRLPAPELTAGKVFTPGVRSMMQFTPTLPWQPMKAEDLDALIDEKAHCRDGA